MGLQSGFVFAVIVAALLAANQLGGPEEIIKRFFQLALAVTVAFAVISGTEAFVRNSTPTESSSIFGSDFDTDEEESLEYFEDSADRTSLRRMIQFAAGIVSLVGGVFLLRRFAVTGLALALGGVLLILFGGAVRDGSEGNALDGYLSIFTSLISSIIGQPSRLVDISEFVVLAAGAVVLLLVGLRTWDMPEQPPPAVTDAPVV